MDPILSLGFLVSERNRSTGATESDCLATLPETRSGHNRAKSVSGNYLMRTLTALLFLCSGTVLNAQTNGVVAVAPPTGGFNIDGSPLVTGTTGDWIPASGTGGSVMNSAGTVFDAGKSFHTVDAYNSTTDNTLASGLKWNQDPGTWTWASSSASNKTDINHGYVHFSTRASDGHVWVAMAGDRLGTTGTSYIDFEFLQNTLAKNANGTFTSAGPNGGRTAGDLLITVEYNNGGSVPSVLVYKWQLSGGVYTYVSYTPPPGTVYAGQNSSATAIPMPFNVFGTTAYQQWQFAECAVDLNALITGLNTCIGVKTVMIKTKSSSALSANLDDFLDPIQLNLGTKPTVSATGGILCSGGSRTVTASTSFGVGPFTYAWTVPSGQAAPGNVASFNATVAGNYSVLVTGANACVSDATATTVIASTLSTSATVTGTSVSCRGGSNGTASASPTGGLSPYTYAWTTTGGVIPSGQSTSANLTNLVAGTYNVIVTDANGCTASGSFAVTQPSAALAATAVKTDVSCFGGTNGTATVTATGGTTSYSYSWNTSPVQTGATATGLAAGTYTVTVTDAKGCTTNASATVGQPLAALAASATGTNVNCFGNSTGTASVTASSGTSPYTYSWSNGAASASISSLAANTYTVTVTDAKGCTKTASYTVTEPAAALAASASGTNVNCFGGSTGTASVAVSGGTSGYSYLWSNGATTASISGLAAGTYSVTVTDTKGCTKTASYIVTEPVAALAASATGTNVNCFGAATGSASVTASGGTSPYTYLWSNGGNTASITGLVAGTYSVTVTDAKGCTKTASSTVTEPAAALAASASGTNVNCFGGSTGTASVAASGGTSPYGYSWSNGATTASIGSLAAGTYSVTVTDAKGCTKTASYTVSQPAAALQASAVVSNVITCASPSATVTVSATGGTSSYTGTGTFTVSAAGTYNYTVTDANGCTSIATATVTSNTTAPTVAIAGGGTITCSTTGITLTASGASSYSWSTGASTASITAGKGDIYTVTGTGANGCTNTASVTIGEDKAIPTVSISGDGVLDCNTPSRTLTASGDAAGYNWGNGSATLVVTAAGTYTVTATGANGCTNTASVTIAEDKTTPGASISGNETLTCAKTSITLAASGNGSFKWSNGSTGSTLVVSAPGSYPVTVTGSNGCTSTASALVAQDIAAPGASISGNETLTCAKTSITLSVTGNGTVLWSTGATSNSITVSTPGHYTVTVTGANGCTGTDAVDVAQDIAAPGAAISGNDILTCARTSITLSVAGNGTALWNTGATTNSIIVSTSGTYSVTVTGANGCTSTASEQIIQDIVKPGASISGNAVLTCATQSITLTASGNGTYAWTPGGSTAATLGVSAPGSYSVTVTGANGCTSTDAVVVAQDISKPSISIAGADVLTCTTTSVTLVASGNGVGYDWGNGSASLVVSAPGTYTVIGTAANGCTDTRSITIGQDIAKPGAAISGNAVLTCANTSVTLTVAGNGTAAWSTQESGNSIIVTTPGTYSVTTTSANGCKSTDAVVVAQNIDKPGASISGNETLTCAKTSITLSVTGNGTALWSTGATASSITVSAPGNYSVTVTGANGCTSTASVEVAQDIVKPGASISGNDVLTCSRTSITLSVAGNGTALWSTVATSNSITVSTPGHYTVTVTGANGCTSTDAVEVAQDIVKPGASISGNEILTCARTSIPLSVTGNGTALWNTGAESNSISVSTPGTYSVTVTGANGCTSTASVEVAQDIAVPGAIISGNAVLTCTTQTITLAASGNGSFKWNDGSAGSTLAVSAPGTYSVTVTGANGCTSMASVEVTQDIAAPGATISGNDVLTCSRTSITLSVAGSGTALWSTGATTNSITVSNPGHYSVTVTGANGCTSTASVEVAEDIVKPGASISGNAVLTCATQSITLTVAGNGTALWSTTAASNSITVSAPGTYSVTVTGANGCTSTDAIEVAQDIVRPGASISGNDILTCSRTSIKLVASGNGSFKWNDGSTASSLTVTAPGTYSVVVTGANGCSSTASVDVSQDIVKPGASISGNDVLTCARTSITLLVTGNGTALWSTGATSNSITVTTPGTYSVTITGANGCISTDAIEVTQDIVAPGAGIDGNGLLTCTTGSITLTASGNGNYSWSRGTTSANGASTTVTTPSNVTLTVTGANGCTSSETVTVVEAPKDLSATGSGTNIDCFGNSTGSASVNAQGGTSPYTYAWSNGATTAAVSELPAGSYSVTVTDKYGCTATATINIGQPDALKGSASTGSIACNGGSTSVVISAIGGTTPYTGTGTFNDVTAGQHIYTVSDANGCSTQVLVNISEPSILEATATPGSISCNGGTTSVTVSATGGTAPYTGAGTFTVHAGDYSYTVTDANGCTVTVSGNISEPAILTASAREGLILCNGGTTTVTITANGGTAPYTNDGAHTVSAGPYSFMVTDANGCTVLVSGTISEPTLLKGKAIEGSISCNGGTTSVAVSATGGTAPYTGTGSFTIHAGDYSYTVTDANGCTVVVSGSISEPTLLTATAAAGTIACNGGTTTVNITADGGTAPYSGDGAHTVSAGAYSFTVTDAKGCEVVVSGNISEPSILKATATPGSISCNGGTTSVIVSATGGTAPYTGTGNFTVHAGDYSYTVTDANGCSVTVSGSISEPAILTASAQDGSITCNGGTTTVTISANGGTAPYSNVGEHTVSAGAYSFIVSDANGCTVTVSGTISEPTILSATATAGSIACNGGKTTVTVSATGGTGAYTGTGTYNDVAAGQYTYTVKDANGCQVDATVNIDEPAILSATAVAGSISCKGGKTR
jgi:hypothetical protein